MICPGTGGGIQASVRAAFEPTAGLVITALVLQHKCYRNIIITEGRRVWTRREGVGEEFSHDTVYRSPPINAGEVGLIRSRKASQTRGN